MFGVVLSIVVAACGEKSGQPERPSVASRTTTTTQPAIVARIGTRTITAAEADAPVRLALHDLEMQRYRLRRQVLEARILQAWGPLAGSEKRVADILLEPPSPPRVDVPPDPARLRPIDEAPVTILAFCNFESPHCARLQLALAQVLPLYAGLVRYAERDLPLSFHRYAGQAAEAARCAAEQGGKYWRYHDALYAAGRTPDRTALDLAARATNLDSGKFARCLDSGRHGGDVAGDVSLAHNLGISVVPAVFVNGLYASPDVQPADLVWLIEQELQRTGHPSPRSTPGVTPSSMSVQLQAVIASPHAGQGLALLNPAGEQDHTRAFREGDAIATGAVIRRIAEDGIEVLRDGRTERLGFGAATPARAGSEPPAESSVMTPHRAVPVTLDRTEVLARLSDRIALEAALQPVPMTSGGYHQLRVSAVAPGSLYELLELQPGDVILSVNEQPVHEASNPLWDALEKEGEVRVRVIRRGGLARHFTYRFAN